MSKKATQSIEAPAIDAIEKLVVHLLENDVSAYEISFGLAAVATDFGLHTAPSAEQALEVIADAIRRTVASHSSTNSTVEADSEVEPVESDTTFIDPAICGWTVH